MGGFLAVINYISKSDSLFLSMAIVLFITLFLVTWSIYKEKFVYYILHKRNRWHFILLGLYFTCIMLAKNYDKIDNWQTLSLILFGLLYGIVCLATLNKPIGYAAHFINKYQKKLHGGLAAENISFFDKKPWFVWLKIDKIKYARLKASYYLALGNASEAFEALASISDADLYENELEDFKIFRAMLLCDMGDFSAAYVLVGEPEECKSANPLIWTIYSLVEENRGNLDKAHQYLLQAKALIETTYVKHEVKAQVYNNFGRIQDIRGNNLEASKYYNDAFNEIMFSPNPRIDMLNYIMTNLVLKSLNTDIDLASKYLKEYEALIKSTSIQNHVVFANCAVMYYQQLNDPVMEYQFIYDSYHEILDELDTKQKSLWQASTFRLLMNGHFVHDWFDNEIEKYMDNYFLLPKKEKLAVCKEFIGILQQEEFRYVRGQNPYKELQMRIMNYYSTNAIDDISRLIKDLKPHQIFEYQKLMLDKLGILKLIERENHIAKSQQMYIDLSKMLYDAGLHINAFNVLMILVDECFSPYNMKIQTNPYMQPVFYNDFLESIAEPPPPVLAPNGIQFEYPRFGFYQPIPLIPCYAKLMEEKLDFVIAEYDNLKNHPAKMSHAIHIAHLLMVFQRRDEAKKHYDFFRDSGISIIHFAPWVRNEYQALRQEFEVNDK